MSKQEPNRPVPQKSPRKVSPADDLVKTTRGDIELTESELNRVSGGKGGIKK